MHAGNVIGWCCLVETGLEVRKAVGMNTDHWITAVLALRRATNLVVFTGAGISSESGIPTFRDDEGFWQRFPPERFASWNGLWQTAMTDRHSVVEFVLNVIDPVAKATPNAGHYAVAELQKQVATTVVTQNIDGLHQSAGSEAVLEIHGTLMEVVDVATGQLVQHFDRADLEKIADILRLYVIRRTSAVNLLWNLRKHYPVDWLGRHRPNLVLFGDALAEPAWPTACQVTQECDVLLSVGTSGAVLPAALLPVTAAATGATVISVDPQPMEGCWLQGKAGDVLPRLISDAFGPGVN